MTNQPDPRLQTYIQALQQLARGEYPRGLKPGHGELGQLGKAIQALSRTTELRAREARIFASITAQINTGLQLADILERVFIELKDLIPYQRIGVSLMSADGEQVRSIWSKSDLPTVNIKSDYAAPINGSSLAEILKTGQPRIINDLKAYLAQKPESTSTQLIVAEGIRSSLTCPLLVEGQPIGFVFFSSAIPHTYQDVELEFYQRIAGQLAILVERARLVSELAEQKNAIEEQNRRLHHLNEIKTTFLGMAAHDLRHPLGYIQLAAQLLEDEQNSPTGIDQREFIVNIGKQVLHMQNLLDELLDVTTLETGNLNLEPEWINLRPFISEVVAHQSRIATIKGTQILIGEIPDCDLYADLNRLYQVLDNLISNAVKYSPHQSTVLVFAECSPAEWRICVADEGPGIRPDEREQLFKDFARLSARPTGGEKSTGLGLSIARRIMEAHGGKIGVDSVPGEGATFWFTLPNKTKPD